MDKEKEIKTLTQQLFDNIISRYHICGECSSRKCKKDNIPHCGNCRQVAEVIIDAGYYKADKVRKETAKEILQGLESVLDGLIDYPSVIRKSINLLREKYGVEVDG